MIIVGTAKQKALQTQNRLKNHRESLKDATNRQMDRMLRLQIHVKKERATILQVGRRGKREGKLGRQFVGRHERGGKVHWVHVLPNYAQKVLLTNISTDEAPGKHLHTRNL